MICATTGRGSRARSHCVEGNAGVFDEAREPSQFAIVYAAACRSTALQRGCSQHASARENLGALRLRARLLREVIAVARRCRTRIRSIESDLLRGDRAPRRRIDRRAPTIRDAMRSFPAPGLVRFKASQTITPRCRRRARGTCPLLCRSNSSRRFGAVRHHRQGRPRSCIGRGQPVIDPITGWASARAERREPTERRPSAWT